MAAQAFAEHLPLAVAAAEAHGQPLALLVLRGLAGSRRGRRRLHDALRAAPGFSYRLQRGAYAVLLPGLGAREACDAALELRRAARGGLLVSGALVHAGLAVARPGLAAERLFAAAAAALAEAEDADRGVVAGAAVPEAPTVTPAS